MVKIKIILPKLENFKYEVCFHIFYGLMIVNVVSGHKVGRYNSFEFQISIFIAFCGVYMHGKYKKFLKDE